MQRNLKSLVTAVLGSNYIKKMTKITSNNSRLMKIPKTGLNNFQFSVHVPLYTSQKTLKTKNLHLN